jgi:uncharacterized protein YqiB (DUF1249 family)
MTPNPERLLEVTVRKERYKVDIVDLHAVCEANYARLLQLFPEYETANVREFQVGGSKVRLEVVDRSRFTTIFRLLQSNSALWLGQLNIELRAYHDARMLEVGSFQSHRRIAGRYGYPNNGMYQQDEKSRQNHFLAEWLSWCLQHGCAGSDLVRIPES